MGWWKRFREGVAGPPRVNAGTDDPGEVAADLHEEFSVPDAGDTEMRDIEERTQAPAAPIAAAPFSGEGEIRATELEAGIIKPEDVKPDDAKIESEPDPVDPDN